MTQLIQNLKEIVDQFDIVVLDQWGVLHNGTVPYPHAAAAMQMLQQHRKPILVVSNSGKRADLNRQRIQRMGLPVDLISKVVTSGEALWEDITERRLQLNGRTPSTFFAICAKPTDPIDWAAGSDAISIQPELRDSVDAILLMGLPDGTAADAYDSVLTAALDKQLPIICSNPDKTSPRADGLVTSPGALADRYEKMGGTVFWYGKPHSAIYRSVVRTFPETAVDRFLMVGDSLEHDIAGAQKMGFASAFIRGGIHADDFVTANSNKSISSIINQLIEETKAAGPDFSLSGLQ